GFRQPETRLAVAARRALEKLGCGGHRAAVWRMRYRIERIGMEQFHRVGISAQRLHRRVVQFVELVEQYRTPLRRDTAFLCLASLDNEVCEVLLRCNRSRRVSYPASAVAD